MRRQVTEFLCSRCGSKEYHEAPNSVWIAVTIKQAGNQFERDFCPSCANLLKAYMGEGDA
jgi:hypothetical protein